MEDSVIKYNVAPCINQHVTDSANHYPSLCYCINNGGIPYLIQNLFNIYNDIFGFISSITLFKCNMARQLVLPHVIYQKRTPKIWNNA